MEERRMNVFQLVLGRSGSGKSTYVCELVSSLPPDRVLLVVPEQFTLETERRLLEASGKTALPKTVTSFSGLARDYHLLYEPAGTYINDFGKHILMDRALREEKDALRLYGGKVSRSLIECFLSLSSEMKSSCLSADELMELSASQPGGLSDKLHDIALVSAHYDTLVSAKYLDALDDLTRLADGILKHGFCRGKTVVFDGFHNFSVQEERVIEALMLRSEKVIVTMPCGSLNGEEPDAILFENVREDAKRLIGMAEKHGVPREKTDLLKENRRAKNDALKEWERSSVGVTTPFDDCNGIELYSAANASEESSLLASLIAREVKEGNSRYREHVIIARSVNDYETLLQNALSQANIPFYIDTRADIRRKPLFVLMGAALETAAGKRREESVFRCLKTGFFPAEEDAIYRLENYCLLWNLNGREIFDEYKGHPRGFDEPWTDNDRAVLQDRNDTRLRVMPPLARLCSRLTGRFTGETLSRALYDFLTELHVPEQIDRECERLREQNEAVAAEEPIRLWEQAVAVLDQIAVAAGDVSMTSKEALDLFDVACANADMGRIPPTADAVTVGSADRIRVPDVKNVYLFGFNEGDFPRTSSGGGLLTDRDRRALKEKGLRFGGDAVYWSVEELFIAYKAFAAPSEKLTILYHRADPLGNKTEPSALLRNLTNKFPSLHEKRAEELPLSLLSPTRAAALSLLARRKNDPAVSPLREALSHDDRCAPILQSMERAQTKEDYRIGDPDRAAALFGRDMQVSASKIEAFHECRYQYFLRYGLRLTPLEPFGLHSNTLGTIAHDILEHSLCELCDSDLASVTPAEVNASVASWAKRFYDDRMDTGVPVSPSMKYQFERTEKTVAAIANHLVEELKQSQFKPVAFELGIGRNGEIPPYELPCADGSVRVEGKIDRVDRMEGEKPYLRVVDYKTGTKEFDLSHLLEGKDMQMLLYLFTLQKNGGSRFADAKGCGVLYCPVKRDDVNEQATEEKNEEKRRLLKRMNGLFLQDETSLRGMEKDLAGQYIPIRLVKDEWKGDTLVSEEDMSVLSDYIDLSLIRMHDDLNAGHIEANPTEESRSHCDYCRYKSVCAVAPEKTDGSKTKKPCDAPMAQIREAVEAAKGGEPHGA